MMVVKMKSMQEGNRVRETFFIGEEGFTLQNAGSLLLEIGEWQLLGAALLCSQEIVNKNYPRLKVICEGDKSVLTRGNHA